MSWRAYQRVGAVRRALQCVGFMRCGSGMRASWGRAGRLCLRSGVPGCHWMSEPAQGMADVLGGEVVVWDGVSDDVTVAVPEEPF